MSSTNRELTKLRGEFEEFGNSLALILDVATSGIQLSERGRAAFVEYGITSIQRLDAASEQFQRYAEGALSS